VIPANCAFGTPLTKSNEFGQMNAPIATPDDEDIIDSRKVIAVLTAKRWWVLGSVVLSTAAFTAAAFLMTPIYRSTTVLVAASNNQNSGGLGGALGDLGGIASLAGINVGTRTSVTEEALAVLKSREFTERFIADENLMPRLFAKKWDAAAGKWKAEPPTPDRAYRYFNEKIRSVDQDKKTGLITVQIDWKDRNEAAAWLNELVRRLNQEMRVRAITDADASLGYLDKELQATTVVVTHDAIGHLIESQVKQRMLATVSKEFAFRVVDRGMPADADDPIKPQKLVMIAAGITLGVMIGMMIALLSGGSRRQTAELER
jgi:uncharacterized protein involved in exopolysaccharide biosynthesis